LSEILLNFRQDKARPWLCFLLQAAHSGNREGTSNALARPALLTKLLDHSVHLRDLIG
jgi:hypothetical protein